MTTMASQMMTSQPSSAGRHQGVPPLEAPLPAGRVNAAITRMLSGARLASALWAETAPPRRRGGHQGDARLTSGVQSIVGAGRRGTGGLGVGSGPRDRLLQRYAQRSYPALEDAGVSPTGVSSAPIAVSMRRKSELTSRRLQASLVDEVAEGLREELGLTRLDGGQDGVTGRGGRSGYEGRTWYEGRTGYEGMTRQKALSMSDLSHAHMDIPITFTQEEEPANRRQERHSSVTNDPERRPAEAGSYLVTPDRAQRLLNVGSSGGGGGGGSSGGGEGRARRRRRGQGNRSVTNTNRASSPPPQPALPRTAPRGEHPQPSHTPPQTVIQSPPLPQKGRPKTPPGPSPGDPPHLDPARTQEETPRSPQTPHTPADNVTFSPGPEVNLEAMNGDVGSRGSYSRSHGDSRSHGSSRRPPPTVPAPPPPSGSTAEWRASPQTLRMPISGSLSRTAEMIRDRRVPPMPAGPPPPPPAVLVVGDPEGPDLEDPDTQEDVLVPADDPVDLDVIPDGINRKHLPMLRDKRVLEARVAARLERRLVAEDALLADLEDAMTLPTMREKVETSMKVINDVIRTSIVTDRAAGNRVYSVLVDLGNFHRHVTRDVDGHVVRLEGTTFGDPETALTKELVIEFPESVDMGRLKVRQVGPTVELDVPFTRSEVITDLLRVVDQDRNRMEASANMAADDEDGVSSVLSDQTLSVLTDPADLGDLDLPDLPTSPPPPAPSSREPKPMRRRRKTNNGGNGSPRSATPNGTRSGGSPDLRASPGRARDSGYGSLPHGTRTGRDPGYDSLTQLTGQNLSTRTKTNGVGPSASSDRGYEAFRKPLVEAQNSDSQTYNNTGSTDSIDSLYGSEDMDFVEEKRSYHKGNQCGVKPHVFETGEKTESKVEMDEDFVTIRHIPVETNRDAASDAGGDRCTTTPPESSPLSERGRGGPPETPPLSERDSVVPLPPVSSDKTGGESQDRHLSSTQVTSVRLGTSLKQPRSGHKDKPSRKIKVRKMSNPDNSSVVTDPSDSLGKENGAVRSSQHPSEANQHMGDEHVTDGHMGDGHVGDGHVGDGHVGDGHVGDGHAVVDDWISVDCDEKDVTLDEGHLKDVTLDEGHVKVNVSESTPEEGESGISVRTGNGEEDVPDGGQVLEVFDEHPKPHKVHLNERKVHLEPPKVHLNPNKVYLDPSNVHPDPHKVHPNLNKVHPNTQKVHPNVRKVHSESKETGHTGAKLIEIRQEFTDKPTIHKLREADKQKTSHLDTQSKTSTPGKAKSGSVDKIQPQSVIKPTPKPVTPREGGATKVHLKTSKIRLSEQERCKVHENIKTTSEGDQDVGLTPPERCSVQEDAHDTSDGDTDLGPHYKVRPHQPKGKAQSEAYVQAKALVKSEVYVPTDPANGTAQTEISVRPNQLKGKAQSEASVQANRSKGTVKTEVYRTTDQPKGTAQTEVKVLPNQPESIVQTGDYVQPNSPKGKAQSEVKVRPIQPKVTAQTEVHVGLTNDSDSEKVYVRPKRPNPDTTASVQAAEVYVRPRRKARQEKSKVLTSSIGTSERSGLTGSRVSQDQEMSSLGVSEGTAGQHWQQGHGASVKVTTEERSNTGVKDVKLFGLSNTGVYIGDKKLTGPLNARVGDTRPLGPSITRGRSLKPSGSSNTRVEDPKPPGSSNTRFKDLKPSMPSNNRIQDVKPPDTKVRDTKPSGSSNTGVCEVKTSGPSGTGVEDKKTSGPSITRGRSLKHSGSLDSRVRDTKSSWPSDIGVQDVKPSGLSKTGVCEVKSSRPSCTGVEDLKPLGPTITRGQTLKPTVLSNKGLEDAKSTGSTKFKVEDLKPSGSSNAAVQDPKPVSGSLNSGVCEIKPSRPSGTGVRDLKTSEPSDTKAQDAKPSAPSNSGVRDLKTSAASDTVVQDVKSSGPSNIRLRDLKPSGSLKSRVRTMKPTGPLTKAELLEENERVVKLKQMFEGLGQSHQTEPGPRGHRKVLRRWTFTGDTAAADKKYWV